VLKLTVDAAKEANIAVSVCGEMAGDTDFTPILLGLGVSVLSMNMGSIPKIKRLVRELHQSECEALLAAAMDCTQVRETEAMVRHFMLKHLLTLGAL
jgi:phosphotransferase system enzyme I (PtsI)